jgi:tetratricopeptide (TPR) repeat protein
VTGALVEQLKHTNALVRQMAVQAMAPLAQAGQSAAVKALQPRLNDVSRNVRMEAARHLAASLDTNTLAGTEYMHFLDHISDQPLGQMQIGVFELMRGGTTNALEHFQKAANWDPYSAGIRHELAIVYSQTGRTREAVAELEAAVRLAPNEAEFHYKLALALNEAGEPTRVVSELEQAVKCDPRHARAWYNLGLARSGRGDADGAVEALLKGEAADPNDARIPYARATVLARMGRIFEAREATRRALQLEPGNQAAAGLLEQLNRQ